MLGSCLTEINPEYHSIIKLAAMLTLVVESFFSKMRVRNDMPTVLEFAYLFSPAIHKNLEAANRHRFRVLYLIIVTLWISRNDGTFLWGTSINSFPNLNRNGKEGRQNDFERLERQPRKVCASADCTKPKYQRQRLHPSYLCLRNTWPSSTTFEFATVDQTPRLARTESIAPSGAACRTILFRANPVLIVKRDHIRRQSGVAANGPFFIQSLQTDVTEDDHESYFDLQLYVPSFQDCLNFIHQGKTNVPRDTVICNVDETEIETGHCFIKLSEETYEIL